MGSGVSSGLGADGRCGAMAEVEMEGLIWLQNHSAKLSVFAVALG